MANKIKYKSGYKYQLVENISFNLLMGFSDPDRPQIRTRYVDLSPSGALLIVGGYAWDGPSGPTIDSKNFMRGSLVHDALYQLMRSGHLDPDKYRDSADKLLREICRHDGMSAFRAWYVYRACRLFAKKQASGRPKQVIEAP